MTTIASRLGLLTLAMLALAVGSPAASVGAQAPIVVKVGTVSPADSPRSRAAYELQRVAQERSKGRIKVEVHVDHRLARGEGATLEGVQIGTIDVAPVGSAPIGGIFEPAYVVLDLPFLWPGREQAWNVLDGPVGQELFKKIAARGVRGLCFGGGWGFRHVASNKRAIHTPDDLTGLKIRVPDSPLYGFMMKQLGATPVPMPWREVSLAMKRGTLDGLEASAATMVADKLYEVARYYSLTYHAYAPISWFMNARRYESLPADLRRAIDDAGRAACALDRAAEVEQERRDLELMRKAGVQINDVKDRKAFRERVGPAYDYVGTKVGQEWADRFLTAALATWK